MKSLKHLAPALLILPCAICQTQFDAKPGLWETTTSTQMSGASVMSAVPPEALARLTPEQRAQFEANMKNRMGATNGAGAAHRSCITKEQLSKPFPMSDDRAKSCKNTLVSSTPNHQEVHMECEMNGGQAVGTLKIDATTPESVTGTVQMKVSFPDARSGAPRTMDSKSTFTGKWISSDCGDVKPGGAK